MGQGNSRLDVLIASISSVFVSKTRKDNGEANRRYSIESITDQYFDTETEEDDEVEEGPSFHPFPRLPAELRLKIWELVAVHRHQVVELMPVETWVNLQENVEEEDEDQKVAVVDKVAVKFMGRRFWTKSLPPPQTRVSMDNPVVAEYEIYKHWKTHAATPAEIASLRMTCAESACAIEKICPPVTDLHLIRCRTSNSPNFNHTFTHEQGTCCRQLYNPANITIFLRAYIPNPIADIPPHIPYEAKQTTSLALEYVPSKQDIVPYLAKVLGVFRKLEYLVIVVRHDERIGRFYHPVMYGWRAENVNIYRPIEVTRWFSAIDHATLDSIKEKEPGWKMPLVKSVVRGNTETRRDLKDIYFGKLAYDDVFPSPESILWQPFQRLGGDGKWFEVDDHRGPEEYN